MNYFCGCWPDLLNNQASSSPIALT